MTRTRKAIRWIPGVRSAHRRLVRAGEAARSGPLAQAYWRGRLIAAGPLATLGSRFSGAGRPQARFSLELAIIGRNDEYEPGWAQRFMETVRYNTALFRNSGVDLRVAFVEWNPPPDRPLLAPTLTARFDNIRVIVVDSVVHDEISESSTLPILLNFGLNAAVRTTESDFCLITGGDVLIGLDVVRQIEHEGLEEGVLYRAVRVDVDRSLNLTTLKPGHAEIRARPIRINFVAESPFTNASGDFILMDRASFIRVGGLDEGTRRHRLHLDARCCLSAVARGMRCELIGHVLHLDHRLSHANTPAVSDDGSTLDSSMDLPYINPPGWGLRDRIWRDTGERIAHVS